MIFFSGFHLFLVIIGKNPLRNFLGTIPTCTFIHLQLPNRQICMDREHWVKNSGICNLKQTRGR